MLTHALTDLPYLQSLLGHAGVIPSRSAGQNFLVSPEVVEATLAAVQAGPAQVTELGAGVGPLTQALVHNHYKVRAIERDPALAGILKKQLQKFIGAQLQVITDDLRHTAWEWEEPYQLVGNIPYNLSGLILRSITQLAPAPHQAVLLVQQEVGERVCAQPPHMQLLSLAVQLWGHATPVLSVPPSCFWPEPQVHSQIIIIEPSTTTMDTQAAVDREAIIAFAKPLFQQRRKQLGSVLPKLWGVPKTDVHALLGPLGIAPTQRPQELSVSQWRELYKAIG